MSHRPGPIVTPLAAPLRTLTVAMAVMCYLACLAIGALILIDRAVDAWTGGLEREVTVQIRQTAGADIEEEVEKARALLEDTPGVAAVDVMSRAESARLLEPWLGTISNVEELPVPRLIAVTLDRKAPPDLALLGETVVAEVRGANLDTHEHWQGELTRMAGVLTRLAFAVLLLICVSAVAVVTFAARTVLDANRGIVDVLQLAGARDGFIARQIERRFLRTGLAAGLLGMFAGIGTFLLMGLVGPWSGVDAVANASRNLLFAPIDIAWRSYGALLAVPLTATLIVLVTARTTLIQMLRGFG